MIDNLENIMMGKLNEENERLKVLLVNAVGIYAEAHLDRYNTRQEFLEFLYSDLGTDETELEELGVDLSEI